MLIQATGFPRNIKWIGDYHPYRLKDGERNPKFDSFSNQILRLKESKKYAIDFFYEKVNATIGNKSVVLLCIPSSDPANILTGIRALTKQLVNETRIDGNECLIRKIKLDKKAQGGSRNFVLEKASLEIKNPQIIKGKDVVLLDDVTTTGISLKAASKLLLENGVKSVECLALGRTNRD